MLKPREFMENAVSGMFVAGAMTLLVSSAHRCRPLVRKH
jgi:hypothetical protein